METGSLQRRHIAYKLKIKDILKSRYIKTGGVNPNYLEVNGLEVSRVNVIGVAVQKSYAENYSDVVIDDGTGKISARTFESSFSPDDADIGDSVLVVGRPREYMGEKYILAEIVKKIDPLWAKIRSLELGNITSDSKNNNYEKNIESEDVFDESPKNRLLKAIKELDKGEGVSVEDLPPKLGNVDQIIGMLLREGDVFEVRPGKLKVLE